MSKKPFYKKLIIHRSDPQAPLPDITDKIINTGSRRAPRALLPIYGGYDVETTTLQQPEGFRSAVWSHAFALANSKDCHVYLFRRWSEFHEFIEHMIDFYDLSLERRLILWDANLSFEFSFLQHRLSWDEVFAKEMRQPLLASHHGLEFRECLSISGGNLAMLAKNFCATQKMVGDLDYKKLRNEDTPVTKGEQMYIINDVVILAEYSKYLFDTIIRPRRYIPMTSTGIINSNIKERFKKRAKELGNGDDYLTYIKDNYPDEEHYFFYYRYLFRGGYVHANALYCNVDLRPENGEGVRQKDITSSYPAVMLCDYVPRGAFHQTDYDPEILKSKCCVLYIRFQNIRIKTHHTIESANKVIDTIGAEWDNGRLIRADVLRVCLTELDLKIYRWFYEWDLADVYDFYTADRSTLPKFLIDNLLEEYIEKNRLKSAGLDNTPEYGERKKAVNGHYGLTVKRIRLNTIKYGENPKTGNIEWWIDDTEKDYDKEVSKNILLPYFGIYITAWARFRLLSVVKRLDRAGVAVIYCDTDSIKYIEHPSAERIFRAYNKSVAKRLRKRGYRSGFLRGLGEFSDELGGEVCRFKSLGAKRYIYYDYKKNKIKATVAGMPKSSIQALGDSLDHIFDMFSDAGFCLTMEESGKLRPEYTDDPYDIYVDGQWMHEESGCALVETPFTVTLKDEYIAYIHQAQNAARLGGAL